MFRWFRDAHAAISSNLVTCSRSRRESPSGFPSYRSQDLYRISSVDFYGADSIAFDHELYSVKRWNRISQLPIYLYQKPSLVALRLHLLAGFNPDDWSVWSWQIVLPLQLINWKPRVSTGQGCLQLAACIDEPQLVARCFAASSLSSSNPYRRAALGGEHPLLLRDGRRECVDRSGFCLSTSRYFRR